MKIKTLMDFLNKESPESQSDQGGYSDDEKIIYIGNSRLETAQEQTDRRELLAGGTQWADQSLGDILVDLGKLSAEDVDQILQYQRDKGLYFGEAAVELNLADESDILQALSTQFGYTYDRNEESLSKEMVMAYSPFGEQAEEFRAIREQLLNYWLNRDQKTLAVVSPESKDGRSYVAANLALAFSQLGRSTLLIDADLRSPQQHNNFKLIRRIGLSMLLARRVRMGDLDYLPNQISSFQHLSVLGSGAVPPNPAELLGKSTFSLILRELKKFFDVIIIDTPSATYQADILSITSVAGSALLVARGGHTRMESTKHLLSVVSQARAKVVGAVLNQY
jgi:receptor protein-tyrosine kinase